MSEKIEKDEESSHSQDEYEEEGKSETPEETKRRFSFESWKLELDEISIEMEKSINAGDVADEITEPLIELHETQEEEDLNRPGRNSNEQQVLGLDAKDEETWEAEGDLCTHLRPKKVTIVKPISEKKDE